MTHLSIIVAYAKNRVIGLNNTLPWYLPEDLKRFKMLTMGHHIIMGRKTYDSLGRLLPGRTTVIVTRNPDFKVEGAIVVDSLESALNACDGDDEAFLIGGAELYHAGLGLADKLYVTEIDAQFEGDAYFPPVEPSMWHELSREAQRSEMGIHFHYVVFGRR
ncbi:MAG TPA: dihydrofolate reductase [Methylophilus sp.]|mgnify:CR=1 FL=1|nr:dihydrofolate reductase [Methylophilus sp.]HQQ32482.1 dihydrofolate reductase [Methylophilus sp.]